MMNKQDDYSIDSLIHWLDAKYSRHGEIEDKMSADMLRSFKATPTQEDKLQQANARIAELEEDVLYQTQKANNFAEENKDLNGKVGFESIEMAQKFMEMKNKIARYESIIQLRSVK